MMSHPAEIAAAPPCARYAIRVAPSQAEALGVSLGIVLPSPIGATAEGPGWLTLCLGPDEWTVIAAPDTRIAARAADTAGAIVHSLVDISARELAFELSGPEAAGVLNAGCPADLDTMPCLSAARTVFDGVQIVLFKRGEHRFRLEVWRSFAPHIVAVLRQAGCSPLTLKE